MPSLARESPPPLIPSVSKRKSMKASQMAPSLELSSAAWLRLEPQLAYSFTARRKYRQSHRIEDTPSHCWLKDPTYFRPHDPLMQPGATVRGIPLVPSHLPFICPNFLRQRKLFLPQQWITLMDFSCCAFVFDFFLFYYIRTFFYYLYRKPIHLYWIISSSLLSLLFVNKHHPSASVPTSTSLPLGSSDPRRACLWRRFLEQS